MQVEYSKQFKIVSDYHLKMLAGVEFHLFVAPVETGGKLQREMKWAPSHTSGASGCIFYSSGQPGSKPHMDSSIWFPESISL